MHKWVGTYNQFLRILKPLYKWLYYPDEEPKHRKLPEFLVGVNQLHRKEKTTYSANDMWTEEDDKIFLKYCEDPLIRLYHTMSRDFSNRPHELLRVRIGEIIEGIDLEGKRYAPKVLVKGEKRFCRYMLLVNWVYESSPC